MFCFGKTLLRIDINNINQAIKMNALWLDLCFKF